MKIQNKKRTSIINQTVRQVSAVFLLVIALLVCVFTGYLITYMKNRILETQRFQMDTVVHSMETRLDALSGPIISLGEYNPTQRMVTGYYKDYSPEWMNNVRTLDAYLSNISLFTSYIIDINLLNRDGSTVYSMNDLIRKDYDYKNAAWFQDALSQNRILCYAPPHGEDHLYQRYSGVTFSMIYPIHRGDTEVGYVLMEIDLLKIADFLGSEFREGETYFLIDEQSRIIYPIQETFSSEGFPGGDLSAEKTTSTDMSEEKQTAEGQASQKAMDKTFIEDTLIAQAVTGDSKAISKGNKYFILRKLSANGWTVAFQGSRAILLEPVRKLVALVVVLAILTVAGILLVIRRMTGKTGKPLNALVDRINSYDGSGAREMLVYDDAPTEVAVIGERFEHMADKMNDLIQEVYLARLKQKEAELDALVNQINPHFLYNVLQLIETRAVLADNREIEDMIQALSQMMRYTMERGKDLVKLQEELDYIQNYLMFYQARFPGMFEYDVEWPGSLREMKILKFILQPIVENCIKHAFDRSVKGNRLCIRAEKAEGKTVDAGEPGSAEKTTDAGEPGGAGKTWAAGKSGDVKLIVWDNGCGISKERLKELRDKLEGNDTQGGIGVANTNARIRLVYGDRYGISIESRQGEFTQVEILVRESLEANKKVFRIERNDYV